MDKELKHDLQHTPKEIKITLDKERTFILDLNAYSELDLCYKDKTYHEIEMDLMKMRPYAIRAFLWAGMVHEDRSLTIDHVGKYIDVDNVATMAEKLYKIVLDDQPESVEEGTEKKE